jgi:membrane protein required for beta-lactamase induction
MMLSRMRKDDKEAGDFYAAAIEQLEAGLVSKDKTARKGAIWYSEYRSYINLLVLLIIISSFAAYGYSIDEKSKYSIYSNEARTTIISFFVMK